MKDKIRKYALQNAVKFNGKANPGAVIGKLFGEEPGLKKKAKDIGKEVAKVVKEVNSMKLEKQLEELKKSAPELLEEKKKEKRTGLPELKNAKKGKVVMRFEPSPSGPMHVGHAFTLGVNSEYCRMYDGKLILRISDTNPQNIYDKAYDLIPKDADWVTKDNIAEFYVQSDRMKVYYKYAEDLIKMGKAYVCHCKSEDFREKAHKMQVCPCRKKSAKENMKEWKDMFTKYQPGDCILRIKTDIKHKNPAIRDWPAFRILDMKHPRQGKKYRVWPLMSFSVGIDDMDMNMTHVIKSKDHITNTEKQSYLFKYFKKKVPEHIHTGRINFLDLRVSCSKTRPLIESGKFTGWDDIRLPFLLSLRRRGYQPEAFIKYSIDVGPSKNDKTVSGKEFFKVINAFNKDVIDAASNRYFFVADPVEIKVEKAPEQDIELDLHPSNVKGGRKFKTKQVFYVSKHDHKEFKAGKLYRLMDCLNFKKQGKKFVFDSLEYEKYKNKGERIIHWLPKDKELVNVAVMMPEGHYTEGYGEKSLSKLKKGDIVQLERFGFCRLDEKKKDKLVFWFTHK